MVSNRTVQEWMDEFVLEEEAARILGISTRTLIRRGELKGRIAPQAYRCGRGWRYLTAEVIAFAEARCTDSSDKGE